MLKSVYEDGKDLGNQTLHMVVKKSGVIPMTQSGMPGCPCEELPEQEGDMQGWK